VSEIGMDDIDRRLLALLRVDARASVARLAKAVNLSRGAAQNRIDRMIARGEIAGFTIRAGAGAGSDRDRVRAIMAIAVEGERSAAVLRRLRGVAAVEAVHMTNGRWDMIAELATETLAGFSAALDEIRLVEGIAATETSLLLSTVRM
jgi:DNA-binding Lrp family transcriptional regulator